MSFTLQGVTFLDTSSHLVSLMLIFHIQNFETFNSRYNNHLFHNLTFRGTCIVIYSYNKSQRDALFLDCMWQRNLHVSDSLTVHHQEF